MDFARLARLFAAFLAACLLSHPPLHAESLPDASDPTAGMGINIHFTDAQPGELEMLSRAGFHWVRMDLTWQRTEKTAGVYDFSAYDRLMQSLDKFHIHPLFILDYANPLYDGGAPTHSDEGRAAFARWAVAAVTHFKGRGAIWEIWNEPNGDWFWKPHANVNDYAQLALTVSKAIRQAAPDEPIVGPALSGTKLDFLETLGKDGVFADWSAITIHPYLHNGPESYGSAYLQTREIICKCAAPGQPLGLMCGESGYTTTWKNVDDTVQAKYLARLFLFNVLSGVCLTIWYDWHDDGTDPFDPEAHYGIVRHDYKSGASDVYDPKPSYAAARTYSQALDGYRFKERLKTASENDYVLSFTRSNDRCVVAWTTGPHPHQVKISLPDGIYISKNFDGGKQTEVASTGGMMILTIDDGPQYLKPQ
jgi:hypothetical protein